MRRSGASNSLDYWIRPSKGGTHFLARFHWLVQHRGCPSRILCRSPSPVYLNACFGTANHFSRPQFHSVYWESSGWRKRDVPRGIEQCCFLALGVRTVISVGLGLVQCRKVRGEGSMRFGKTRGWIDEWLTARFMGTSWLEVWASCLLCRGSCL